MRSQRFKFKLLIIIIITGLLVTFIIKNVDVKNNHFIKENNITEVTSNKSEELQKQQLKSAEIKDSEIKKQQVIKQNQDLLETKWKIGYDEFFQKKYVKAIETERQVIKEDPNFYKAYAVEGIALAYSGNFKRGIEQIDRSLKLKPDYAYARFNKALANELYGYYDEAIKWYKSALEIEKFEWSYYGIASVYGRKGDVGNTVKYLKLAIEINPTIKILAKDEEDFNNVQESILFKTLIK